MVERIPIDVPFLNDALEKAKKMFIDAIVPEVLGKWYSRQTTEYSYTESPQISSSIEKNTSPDIWCFCRSEESGEMIACDNVQ